MLLDDKAPKFSMRGQLRDIVPAAYEVKRRRLLAAHLAARAERAHRAARLCLLALLLLSGLAQSCHSSRPRPGADKEYPGPRYSSLYWGPSRD